MVAFAASIVCQMASTTQCTFGCRISAFLQLLVLWALLHFTRTQVLSQQVFECLYNWHLIHWTTFRLFLWGFLFLYQHFLASRSHICLYYYWQALDLQKIGLMALIAILCLAFTIFLIFCLISLNSTVISSGLIEQCVYLITTLLALSSFN